MKKYISVLFLLVLIIPSIAFASWWNPFSWKVFNKKEVTPQIQIEVQKTPEEKIGELQKQLDKLKNQETNFNTTKTPVKSTQKTSVATKVEVSSESSWKAIEDYLFPIADGQGLTDFRTTNHEANDPRYYTKENNTWTWKSDGKTRITLHGGPNSFLGSDVNTISCNGRVTNFRTSEFCPAGQKFDCPETGYNSCVSTIAKNNATAPSQTSNTSIQKDFTRPSSAPSSEEMRSMLILCNFDTHVAKICNGQTFINGFFTNSAFRKGIVDLSKEAEKVLAERKTQSDLDLQRYLLYKDTMSQPIVVPSSHSENYRLPPISTYVTPVSPSLNLNPSPVSWKVQWTGNGMGFITNSSGTSSTFHCDSDSCSSY